MEENSKVQEILTQVQDNEIVFNDRLVKCISEVTKWGIGFGIMIAFVFVSYCYDFIMGLRYFSFGFSFILGLIPVVILGGIVYSMYTYLINIKKGMVDMADGILVEAFRGLKMVVLFCLFGACIAVFSGLYVLLISLV
ncbi:MAG: hypothetical protein ACRCVU_17610 [Flavobacterium sp.]